MNLLTLNLLLASTLALAQDPTFINGLPSPPQSSELDPITTTSKITQILTSSFTTVVSYEGTVVDFQTSDEISGLRVLTTVTKPPGPPETKVTEVTIRTTIHKTLTTYAVNSKSTTITSPFSQSAPSTAKNTTTSVPSTSKTTPGVSTAPTRTPSTPPPSPPKKGIGTTSIILIVFGIVAILTMVGSGAYFMRRRRGREVIEERHASYRSREWNSARPPISSPLNTASLAELNSMTTVPGSTAPSNVIPRRPARPASLTESVQESMRMTPVAGMRNISDSVRSGGSRGTAPTMMSAYRSLSPEPLNIVKEGTASRDRSETYPSTRPHFGDYNNRGSTGIDSYQFDEIRELEGSLGNQEQYLRSGEKDGRIQPLLIRDVSNTAGYSGQEHPSPPAIPPGHTYIQTNPRPRNPNFADADEEDEDERAARRASAQRKFDGESIRSVSTSPPIYDSIAARAEKQRLIAQKQRLIAERQKRDGGKGKNMTDFGPGPMPNYSPPPPPGPPPPGYI